MSDSTKGTTKPKAAAKDAAPVIPADLVFETSGVYDARQDDWIRMAAVCPMLVEVEGIQAINQKRVTKALRRVETPISARVFIDTQAQENDDPLISVKYTLTKLSGKGTAGEKPGQGRKWDVTYVVDGETITEERESPVRQWKYKRDEVQLDVLDQVRQCLAKIYPSLVTIASVATPEEAAAAAEIATLQAALKAKRESLKGLKAARKSGQAA